MENRKQKFEERYNQYKELAGKTMPLGQGYIKGKKMEVKTKGSRMIMVKLAKELCEEHLDFVEALPSTDKIYKDLIKQDYEDSKKIFQ